MLLSVSTRTELGTFLTITQGMTGSLCPVQPVRKSCAGKHAVPLKIHRPWAKHCGEKNSKERFSEKYPLFVGSPSPAPCLSAPPPKLFCLSAPSPSPRTCLPEAFLCFCSFFSLLASFPSLLFSYRPDNSEAFCLRWEVKVENIDLGVFCQQMSMAAFCSQACRAAGLIRCSVTAQLHREP